VDEGRYVRRARPDLSRIEIVFEPIVLPGAGREIERKIFPLLKDPDLSFSLPRNSTGSDVGHRARSERHARVGDVEHRRQDGHPHRRDIPRFRSDERQQQIDVVDHEIEHHGHIRPARTERSQALAVDEPRPLHVRKRSAHRSVETLDVADLDQDALLAGKLQQRVGFLEGCRDRLLDEDVLSALDRRARHRVVGRCGDDNYHRVGGVEQVLHCGVTARAQFLLYFGSPLRTRLEEAAELHSSEIAKNSYVMKAEAPRANHSYARRLRQITTPRSLASTNWISSLTSARGSISSCALSIACVTLRSERNRSRYARLSSLMVDSSIPLLCSPTVLRPYNFTGFPTALRNGGISLETREHPPMKLCRPMRTN